MFGFAAAPLILSTIGLILVLAAGLMLSIRRRRRWRLPLSTGRRDHPDDFDRFDTVDTAEIEARLNTIGKEQAEAHRRRLAGIVQPLVDRGVPARAVEVAPGFIGARIRFADGTTVLACGDTAGDIGILAAAMREGSATPASCTTNATGTHVVFTLPGNARRLSVRVVGVDQPS